ncbi:MAG: hypothetical protein EP300_01130, partial [Gammaproteobacteria bacterium]
MFSKHFIKRLAIVAGSAILSLSTFHSAYAKPGTLVNAPLFLATVVDPNVFFTLDDSGSMDWGPMVRNGTAGISSTSGLPIIEGDDRAYYAPTLSRLYTSRGYLPPSDVDPASLTYTGDWNSSSAADIAQSLANLIAEWNRAWVVRNHIGNRTYYNPSVTYNPWPGLEADGTPMYEDANPKAALRHPDQPGGESVDLTARYTFTSNNWSDSLNGNDVIRITTTEYYIPVYYIWSDTNTDPLLNGNGVIDQTDDRKRVEIPA